MPTVGSNLTTDGVFEVHTEANLYTSDFSVKERASVTLHLEYLPLLEGLFSNSILASKSSNLF